MTGDGLDDPLGTRKAPLGSRRLPRRGAMAVAFGLALVGLGLLAAHEDDGRGGEPFAVAPIDRPQPTSAELGALQSGTPAGIAAPVAATTAPVAAITLSPNPPAGEAGTDAGKLVGQAAQVENGVTVFRPAGNASSNSLVLRVPQAEAVGLAAAPDPRLTESSAFGLLPKIGSDGSRPAEIYARPADLAGNKPRIAILIGGMGLDRVETARAEASLPGAVTFGFAPYGSDLEEQVSRARGAGHEVVLQLPMEDFGHADPPLSHMLLASRQGNEDRLRWLMGRFTGYAGVGTYLGGRLLADEAALQPLLQEVAARGLYFVDDGSAARSLAPSLAADLRLPSVRADVVIDAKPDAVSVTAALEQLEALARNRGFALGMATGLPGTNAIIKRYTADLGHRGVSLVPVSLIVKAEPRSSARNGPAKPASLP